jgi:hypothetical protein
MRQDQRPDEDTRLRTEDIAAADRDEESERLTDGEDTAMADRAETPLTEREGVARTDESDTAVADREDTSPADRDDTWRTDQNDTTVTDREATWRTDQDDTAPADQDDTPMADRDDTAMADRDDTAMADRAEAPLTEREDQAAARPRSDDSSPLQLFQPEAVERFRAEWVRIQSEFVDDPQDSVRNADHLVAEVMQSLATTFNDHKRELEGQWQQGSEVQTEDLRLALRRYRSFFNQLLNA